MNRLPEKFDDLRPYYDSEIPAAMERIAASPVLETVLEYLGRKDSLAAVQEHLRGIGSTDRLQKEIMYPVLKEIVSRTVSEYTYDGVENVVKGSGCLFVSNHRDIVMDAYLQQLALVMNGIETSQITFGSNLMEPQFVVDAGMSNKMFKTVRKSDDYDAFMESSVHLSEYINYVVSHGESVWIAQRNGRTKDGLDKTEPGLIRMLLIGSDKSRALRTLNITPVSVSYQWEPCDILKAVELYRSLDGKPYVKAKGEDLNSIITGITSDKGNVHVSICAPVNADDYSEPLRRSDIAAVVHEMDSKIYRGYRLWDTNYAAYDILNGSSRFEGLYSPALREEFEARMSSAISSYPGLNEKVLRGIYLKIYAGPVSNCL